MLLLTFTNQFYENIYIYVYENCNTWMKSYIYINFVSCIAKSDADLFYDTKFDANTNQYRQPLIFAKFAHLKK